MNQVVDRIGSICKAARRVAFLGVGSPLRADDAIGLYIVEGLQNILKPSQDQRFQFFLGESAPENFAGAIRAFEPDQVLIFDAADLGQEPGAFSLIQADAIGGMSFATHMLPLKLLTDYLILAVGCEVIVIGIQPKALEFAESVTPEVKRAADEFVARIQKVLET